MLRRARARLQSINSVPLSMEIVEQTERQLLEEVVDWYFDLRRANTFILSSRRSGAAKGLRLAPTQSHSHMIRSIGTRLAKLSLATMFVLEVLVRRSLWILGSAVAVVLWLWVHEGTSTAVRPSRAKLGVFIQSNIVSGPPIRNEPNTVVLSLFTGFGDLQS